MSRSDDEQSMLARSDEKGRDVVATRTEEALSSPALESSATDLIAPCAAPRPRRAPLPPTDGVTIGVALSGGGFRATLAGLGVLQFLADTGLLANVRYCSSVSGGSVANGLFAHHYAELEQAGMTGEAFEAIVVQPFMEKISSRSLVWSLVRHAWTIVGPKTRTNVLADTFGRWFYGDRQLSELATSCRFVSNAANLTTGVRFTLERDLMGDYVTGYVPTADTRFRVADAVAASAAFPDRVRTPPAEEARVSVWPKPAAKAARRWCLRQHGSRGDRQSPRGRADRRAQCQRSLLRPCQVRLNPGRARVPPPELGPLPADNRDPATRDGRPLQGVGGRSDE